jgi:hypothetical protein
MHMYVASCFANNNRPKQAELNLQISKFIHPLANIET